MEANEYVIKIPITDILSKPNKSGIRDVAVAIPEIIIIASFRPLLYLIQLTTISNISTQVSTAVISGPTLA